MWTSDEKEAKMEYRKLIVFMVILSSFTLPLAVEARIGEQFHHQTSLSWETILKGIFKPAIKKPSGVKTYPEVKVIKLPQPDYKGLTLEEAIKKRRSRRNYSSKPITFSQLSQLLFSAQGITGKMYGISLRAVPSAGALYPFEIYLIVNNVENLEKGIYHYSSLRHSIELIREGDFRREIVQAGLNQKMLGEAGVVFVLSAVFGRTYFKYGERGYRYIYMEAGHISQNIYLQATSLGLGSVSVGAFLDKEVNQLIGIDGKEEAVIYLHPVGSL